MANILVDIDDTLAQTQKHNLEYIKNHHGKEYKFAEMTKAFREGENKEYDQLVGKFLKDKQMVSEIEPYSFALDSLKKLHLAGHTIHIASARRENLHSVTEQWLQTHGFADYIHHIHPRSSLDKGKDFKVKVVKKNNITIAFDDTWDVSEALANAGVTVYLLHKPWNKDEKLSDNIIRVDNFANGVEKYLSTFDAKS